MSKNYFPRESWEYRKEPLWENIPTALKEIPQWVCWIAVARKGKITKPPISPKTGRLIDITPENKDEFGTLEEAKQFFLSHTQVTINGTSHPVCGVGLVLTSDLNLVGMDFDDCIERNGEGSLWKWGKEDLLSLASYAEESPSEEGARAFCYGNKPGPLCKKGKFEMYTNGRYLTVTGRKLHFAPQDIFLRSEEIEKLYQKYLSQPQEPAPFSEDKKDQTTPQKPTTTPSALAQTFAEPDSPTSLTDNEIIEKARTAKNGAKFSSLWNGQWEGLYGSQSEAELALCCLLAFWTDKEAKRIDQLLRQSGLYRLKWEEKHGRQTYGELTIEKAIATCHQTYKRERGKKKKEQAEKKHATKQKQANKRQAVINFTENESYIGEKGEVIPGLATKYFVAKQAGNLLFYKEAFWQYKDGLWTEVEEKQIRQEIATMLGEPLAKKSVVEDIIYLVTAMVFTDKPGLFDSTPNLLNFRNGMLDLTNDQLLPHERHYFSTIQFAFDCPLDEIREHDLKKRQQILERLCPMWWKFLTALPFQIATFTRLAEWGGYCLTRETRIEKCLLLKGEGANGKSTFLEGILSVLRSWASTLELSQMFDKFKLAQLQGKLVNIATDIDTHHVIDPMFKKLVSGEEVEVEKKFKNPFRFRPFCKFLFSANDFLPTRDKSHGFFRRFDVIEFKKQFLEQERDENVKEIIKSGVEAQGIFCWMYWGLKHLLLNRWKMTPSPEFEATKQEFEMAANPLRQFLEECCTVENRFNERGEPVYWVATEVFRQRYVAWCSEKGYEVLAENKLGREMKRLGFEHQRRRTLDGKRIFIYPGLHFPS